MAGALVGAHSGPDPKDLPDAIVHPPSSPFRYTCGMFSEHASGANILFGDGSVHFIHETIDAAVWSSLCTHRSGEPSGDAGF